MDNKKEPQNLKTSENNSVWNHKPWWCQPWSIILTGFTIISGSWLLFKLVWVTILVSIPISAWMGFFVILFPKLALQEDNSTISEDSLIQK